MSALAITLRRVPHRAARASDERSRGFGSRRGFTLMEMLLAVALATMLLVAVNFFVLSMGELWGSGSEERLFDRHVRGVSRFLDSLVQQSVVMKETTSQTRSTNGSAQTRLAPPAGRRRAPVATAAAGAPRPTPAQAAAVWAPSLEEVWARGAAIAADRVPWLREALLAAVWLQRVQIIPNDGGRGRLPKPVRDADPNHPPVMPGAGRDRARSQASSSADDTATGPRFRFGTPAGYDGAPAMLMFEVDEAPGQCVWPKRPLPQVECALQVNADEGLVLLWKSKLEDDYGKGRPRKTQLSPFARSISFDYYDAERNTWTHSDQPQADGSGGWLVPQRVRVAFVYRGFEREISITLPEVPGGAPLR